jgi:hypothetical protein
MEEARRVIERLDRIDALDRATASPAELLAELRGLLHDAEDWVRVEGGDEGDEAVSRLREALNRDAVPA